MNKEEILEVVSTLTDYPKNDCEKVYDAIFIVFSKFLEKDENINIKNFGTFKVSKRKARTGRNPATGEEIKIKAQKTIHFKVSPKLKEKLN